MMMRKSVRLPILILLAGLLLAACSPADNMDNEPAAAKPTEAMMAETATEEMMAETPDAMMATEEPQEAMMAPAWYSATLTDANSGETFTIEDFAGKVVLVETFAQWCPTCLSQQREVTALVESLGMPDDLVVVSLDVDPNENAEMLKEYLQDHGFAWRFAIAPQEVAREISDLYGVQFLNPPSAPILIIDRHGEAHALPFGLKSSADLQQAIEPFIAGDM